MSSGNPGRATPVDILPPLRYRRFAIGVLLVAVACLLIPAQVLAYRENMYELVVASNPPVIVQNQSYFTSTRQNLFHSATNAITDTEDFAFGDAPETGIQLAQTSGYTATGTETGFYDSSSSSDIVPPVHIGNGFLGTWAGDPLWTGAPIFAGMTFPQMTRTDQSLLSSQPEGLKPSGNTASTKNNTTGNLTQKNSTTFQPVIDYDMNETITDDTTAIPRVGNATAAANTTKQNASSKNATGKPAATPSPAIKPGQVFYHQQNKPFSADLTAPYGPFKSTPAKIRNTSSFDRFLMNTVGRSTTDKAFNGTTSSPTYITPGKALAEQIPYDFIQGARGMTMPGTHLNYRAWPL
jgi:hypothetical protein